MTARGGGPGPHVTGAPSLALVQAAGGSGRERMSWQVPPCVGPGKTGLRERGPGAGGEAAWPRLAARWTSGQLSKGHRPHRATLELFIQDQSVSLRARAPQIVGISLETAPGAPCLGHACARPPGCRHTARSFLRPGAPSWQRRPGARPPLLPRPARGPGLHHVPRFATADFSISEEGLLPAPPSHPRAPS